MRILRTALWHASGPWIERVLAFLAENQDQISGELEYEMELNLQLDRYRRSAHLFVDGSPEREKIDRCIREFCTLDEQEAAERLVRAQLELAANSSALLDAVPFDKAAYSTAYDALRRISHATNVRLGIDWAPPDFNKLQNATMRFMWEVDSLDDPSAWQFLNILKAAFELGLICLLVIIVICVAILQLAVASMLWFKPEIVDTILILSVIVEVIGLVVFYNVVLRKKTTNRWFARWQERIARRKYQLHWRHQALRFLQKMQYSLEDVRDNITAVVQQNPGIYGVSTWLPDFMARDSGLALYSLAHLYEC